MTHPPTIHRTATTEAERQALSDALADGAVVAIEEAVAEPLIDGSGYRLVRRVRRFGAAHSASIRTEAGDAMRRLLSG